MTNLKIDKSGIFVDGVQLNSVTDIRIHTKAGECDRAVLTVDTDMEYSGAARVKIRRLSFWKRAEHKISALVYRIYLRLSQ